MTETPINSEMQKMLPEAVKEVGGLFIKDLLAKALGKSPEDRDQFWSETALKFVPFYKKITGLRQALKNADVTKNAYPKSITFRMRLHFADVENQAVRELLTNLLFARTITTPGNLDQSMEVVDEAQAIASELGSGEGLGSETMKSVDLDMVVEGVLSGGLKLTRQTQLKKK